MQDLDLFEADVYKLILNLTRRIKNKTDIENIKSIISTSDRLLEEVQKIEVAKDSICLENGLVISALANILYILKLTSEYLLNGQTSNKENIYPQIQSYCTNAYKLAENSQNENLKIITNLLGYSLKILCNNSIWEIANRTPTIKKFFDKCLESENDLIYSLLPSQRDSVLDILTMKKSIVLNMPTSAGKTLLAELYILFILQQLQDPDNKPTVCYIVPTNALVNQTKNKLEKELGVLGYVIETVLPFYDVDEIENELLQREHIDILISTPEKLDLLIRQDHPSIENLRLVILDEAHNISEKERGSKFELVLSTIKQKRNNVSFLLLSPFMKNNDKLAAWLADSEKDSSAISIEWTPTKQYVGCSVINKNKKHKESFIKYYPSARNNIVKDEINVSLGIDPDRLKQILGETKVDYKVKSIMLLEKYLNIGKTMVLSGGSTSAQNSALKALAYFKSKGKLRNLMEDSTAKKEIEKAITLIKLESIEDDSLIECLKYGIAYHHAKLSALVKEKIEELMSKDYIDILFATTTLAQGMNFPITTVIFEELNLGKTSKTEENIEDNNSNKKYKVMNNSIFWNIAGRAGRAYKDNEGHIILSYRTSPEYIQEVTQNYIKEDIKEVLSSLTSFFDKLDDNIELNLDFLKSHPAASNFLQYLNHILKVSYNYNFDNLDNTKIRSILNNSLAYREIAFKEGFLESQEKIRRFSEYYINSIKTKNKGQLKLADLFGLSNISFNNISYNVNKLRKEIIDTYGVTQMQEHLNATNIILNSKSPEKLAKIIDIISRLPELKIFMTGEGKLDPETIAKIVIGWVNGSSIREISQGIKRIDQKEEDILGICNKYINSNMKNFIPWGLSVYQYLTKDTDKNLPSYIYYGVNNKEDVILSKIGIPRFALKNVKEAISKKYPSEVIDVKNIDNIKNKVLQLSEEDYSIRNFDKKMIKEIVENHI